MQDRDSLYQLLGTITLDETYIGGPKKGEKRGRGTEKSLVQTALSLDSEGHPGFIKMCVMEDLTHQSTAGFVERHIGEGAIVNTDRYRSYYAVFRQGNYTHEPEKMDVKATPSHLSWVHQIIGNLKVFILGTYHGLGAKHLPAYLSEYCFRTNRRHFTGQVFNRLLNACMAFFSGYL